MRCACLCRQAGGCPFGESVCLLFALSGTWKMAENYMALYNRVLNTGSASVEKNNKILFMITASIVVYHTAAHELLRVINCAVRSAIEILYIIDNSSNDSLRELKDVSEK